MESVIYAFFLFVSFLIGMIGGILFYRMILKEIDEKTTTKIVEEKTEYDEKQKNSLSRDIIDEWQNGGDE